MIMPYNEQDDRAAERRCACRNRGCTNLITAILAVLLSFTVGLILGALFAGILFFALPALIVLGIVLLIGLALSVIWRLCRRDHDCR